eukprot:scaffold4097_cov166-Amphora_coffeaeformis.AAC.11
MCDTADKNRLGHRKARMLARLSTKYRLNTLDRGCNCQAKKIIMQDTAVAVKEGLDRYMARH